MQQSDGPEFTTENSEIRTYVWKQICMGLYDNRKTCSQNNRLLMPPSMLKQATRSSTIIGQTTSVIIFVGSYV